MSNRESGFTLIEAIVAMLVGIIMVVAMGPLTQGLMAHRISSDFDSAAMSLAERQLEQILADANRNPTAVACASTPAPALCGGAAPDGRAHGPVDVNVSGGQTGARPYKVRWSVVDLDDSAVSPFATPVGVDLRVKKVTVTVSKRESATPNATLVRYVETWS